MGGLMVLAASGYTTQESGGPPGWFFGGFFVVWGVAMLFSLAGYVFGIWALVEIIRYREDEFAAVGKNRTTWLVLQIVGLVVCQPMGAVVGVLFLWKHRPALREWREAHPLPPTWYVPYVPPPGTMPPPGYPAPPGYGPPPGYGAPAGSPPPPPPVDPWGGPGTTGGPVDGGR